MRKFNISTGAFQRAPQDDQAAWRQSPSLPPLSIRSAVFKGKVIHHRGELRTSNFILVLKKSDEILAHYEGNALKQSFGVLFLMMICQVETIETISGENQQQFKQ